MKLAAGTRAIMMSTHLEEPQEVLLRRVNIQSSAQLFHLLERQLLVALFAGRLPALLYPDRLSDLLPSRTRHEFPSDGIQLSQCDVPKLKCIQGRSDQMERLVLSVEHVNDGDPSILVLACELKLLAIIPRIGSRPEFLDVLDGNCRARGRT